MADRKPDRRKQRTRQLLRDSLLALILERGYDVITIQDITDHANLGRTTFYLHYRDKENLLISSLEEMFNDLVQTLDEPVLTRRLEAQMLGIQAFRHAEQNRDLYRVMFSGQGTLPIVQRIRGYLVGLIRPRIELLNFPGTFPLPLDILAEHVVGTLLTLILWWLENDLPHSAEYMAKLFQQLTIEAIIARFSPDQKFWMEQ